jgi:hypothetical protein
MATETDSMNAPEEFAELLKMLVGHQVEIELSSGGQPKKGVLVEFHKEYVHVGVWSIPIAHIVGLSRTVAPVQKRYLPPR